MHRDFLLFTCYHNLSVNMVHRPYHNQLSLEIHSESHIIYGQDCGMSWLVYKALTAMGQDFAWNFDGPKSHLTNLTTGTWVGKNVGQGQLMTIQILATKAIVRKSYAQRGLHHRNLVFHS